MEERANSLEPGESAPLESSAVSSWWGPTLIGVSAVVVGGFRSWVPGLWLDEAATLVSAQRSWPSLFTLLGEQDAVHGLYYAFMHVWLDAFGYSPFILRLPSVLAVGVATALVVVLGLRLAGPLSGALAGIVFLLLPCVTWMAGESRSYALATAAVTLAALLFVEAIARDRTGWWIAYGAAVLLASVLYLYATLVLLALPLVLLVIQVEAGRWRAFLIASGVPALAVLVLAREVVSQSGQLDWVGPMTLGRLLVSPRDMWFRNYEGTVSAVAAWVLVLGILVWFVLITARRSWSARSRLGREGAAALLLGWALVPPVVLISVSLLGPSVYLPRHLVVTAPALALAVGIGLGASASPLGPRRLITVLLLVGGLMSAYPWWVQRTSTVKSSTAVAAAAAIRADQAGNIDAVLFAREAGRPWRSTRIAAYAYPDAFAEARDLTIGTPVEDSLTVFETDTPLNSATGRLTGVDRVLALLPDLPMTAQSAADLATLGESGFREVAEQDVGDIIVVTLER